MWLQNFVIHRDCLKYLFGDKARYAILDGIPEDRTIIGLYYDPATARLIIQTESSAIPDNPEGEEIPTGPLVVAAIKCPKDEHNHRASPWTTLITEKTKKEIP